METSPDEGVRYNAFGAYSKFGLRIIIQLMLNYIDFYICPRLVYGANKGNRRFTNDLRNFRR